MVSQGGNATERGGRSLPPQQVGLVVLG
jgi:hypothetical protein